MLLLTNDEEGLAIVLLLLPSLVVDVVDNRWRRRRQVGLIVVVVVVVVIVVIVIVGVLVADQCRGHTNTGSCTQAHPGTALLHTQYVESEPFIAKYVAHTSILSYWDGANNKHK